MKKHYIILYLTILFITLLINSILFEAFAEDLSISNDLYVDEQWAIQNKGQTLRFEVDDIHTEKWSGTPGFDIGLSKIYTQLNQLMKRNVVVAVIDSGLDIDHPDIKNNILKNDAECKEGRPPLSKVEDKDHNGYAGDCMGWNFTSKRESEQNKLHDETGHGTHTAGIIAAEAQNNLGISGLSNHIKILPIKALMTQSEESRSAAKDNKDSEFNLANRFVKAINYAVSKNVDVINMSLGWPDRWNVDALKEAIQSAINKNIMIVVAAGNDDNDLQLFPCSFKNVICVGAVDNRNHFYQFSNYGEHVDLLAPGYNILSLWPLDASLTNFQAKGFNTLSGTSEAAPFVSGAAAILKSVYPGIKNDEVIARLFAGSRPQPEDSRRHTLNGSLNLENSLNLAPRPVIRPIFKSLNRVIVSSRSQTIQFTLPIKNYWTTASNVRVSIKNITPNFEFKSKTEYNFKSFLEGEEKNIRIEEHALSLDAASELQFQVTISLPNEKSHTYFHKIIISRDVYTNELSESHSVVDSKKMKIFDLNTIYSQDVIAKFPQYFSTNFTPDPLQTDIHIYKFKNSKFENSVTLRLPNVDTVYFVTQTDLNYDGRPDYLVLSKVKNNTGLLLQYSFYKNDGSPLIGVSPHFTINFVDALPATYAEFFKDFFGRFLNFKYNLASLKFIRTNTPFGAIALPLYFGEGTISNADFNHIDLDFASNDSLPRLYYFEPDFSNHLPSLKIRTYNNNVLVSKLRKMFRLRPKHDIEFLKLLPQTSEQKENSIAQMMISIGQGYVRKTYIMKVDAEALDNRSVNLSDVSSPDEPFWRGSFSPITELGSASNVSSTLLSASKVAYTTFFTSQLITQTFFDLTLHTLQTFKITYNDPYDHVVQLFHSFVSAQGQYNVFLTQSKILLQTQIGSEISLNSRQIMRSSFLPGQGFEESFTPLEYRQMPAIYINASLVSTPYMYLVNYDNGNLVSKIMYNIDIPSNCRGLDPTTFNSSLNMAMLCQESTGLEFRFIPIY
ncbi:MAG: S8 family peptidase [Bdellovibrionales bacterium]